MKTILAVARLWGVQSRQFDVSSSYLKAYTKDEIDIYPRVPEVMTLSKEDLARVDAKDNSEACLKLVKSLYGLKQAVRLREKLLDKTLADIGFKQSVTDSCVYSKTSSEGTAIVWNVRGRPTSNRDEREASKRL